MRAWSRAARPISSRRRSGKRLEFGNRRGAVGRIEPHAALLGLGLVGRDLALGDGALQQEPGGDLHQAGGQAHALARIGEASPGATGARDSSRPGAVEIGGRLLDELHALLEQGLEGVRTHETLPEPDRIRRRAGSRRVRSPHISQGLHSAVTGRRSVQFMGRV